jgi:hypothetical protein
VSAIASDARKCSAELKLTVLYPKDSMSAYVPSRASASSFGCHDDAIAWTAHKLKFLNVG